MAYGSPPPYGLSGPEAPELDAEEYLDEVGADFRSLEGRIIDMQHRAAIVAGRAREAGRTADYETGIDIIRKLGQINQDYDTARGTWANVRRWVPGLGVVPFFLVAIVTGLAAVVAAIFRQAAVEEHRLELLENGLLTPAELVQIQRGAPAGLAALAPLLVAGGVAFALWKRGAF